MPCDLEDLREDAACAYSNLNLKQLAWANLQIACKLRDWFASDGTFEPENECDLNALLDEGRCVNASVMELSYMQAMVWCELVNVVTQGGSSSGLCSPWMLRKHGRGSPEGVVIGCLGDRYLDLDTGTSYAFAGSNGTKIGWL